VLEIDERVIRPQPATEFVARDDLARVFEQGEKNGERLSRQAHANAVLPDLARNGIYFEHAKADDVGARRYSQSGDSPIQQLKWYL